MLALLKLIRFDIVGTDPAITLFASTGLLFFWLSTFSGLLGFVKLHMAVLQVCSLLGSYRLRRLCANSRAVFHSL